MRERFGVAAWEAILSLLSEEEWSAIERKAEEAVEQARETAEKFRVWQKLRDARERAEKDATASARECELLLRLVDLVIGLRWRKGKGRQGFLMVLYPPAIG